VKLQLLYQASRDGWQGQDFQSRCDNMGATVTVMKCTGGFVFGSYADAPWHSGHKNAYGQFSWKDQWSQSAQAFLFSLHSPSGAGPVKLSLVQDQEHQRWAFAIMSDSTYGPAFGGGSCVSPDLWISLENGNNGGKVVLETRTRCRRASPHGRLRFPGS
jgi:hypothetical protein